MCGIAGVFGRPDDDAVRRMSAAVAHRGPDDAGIRELVDRAGEVRGVFAHRRLSVLDLSFGGHQPMSWGDGRYLITYNGEIFNFRALRDELRSDGVGFTTESDTEVLAAGLAMHGKDFLRRLSGMFALAFWDRDSESVLLARDAFGIKPCYYWQGSGALYFASELRALLASGHVPPVLCGRGVRSYLETGSVAEPWTIIRDVTLVPPGTSVTVTLGEAGSLAGDPLPYDEHPMLTASSTVTDQAEAASAVRRVLRDSVSRHLVSDVPVGCFLSGGIDSSIIVALASEGRSEPLSTFNVVFTEDEYSEHRFATAVAHRFGTRHTEIPLTGSDLLASLPLAFAAMDQPSLDGLNTFVVSGAVRRQGIKVALSGLGGDEFFGGYPSFRRLGWATRAGYVPAPLRRLGSQVVGRVGHTQKAQKIRRLLGDDDPARGAYLASRMLFDGSFVDQLIRASPPSEIDRAPVGLSPIQSVAWYETVGYMRNTLLRDSDVFSMAHGLELRVPFVDRAVAAIAMQVLRADWLKEGSSKPVLVHAMEDLLPREVWNRPKQGFTLPFSRWLRSDLQREVSARLDGEAGASLGLNCAAVRSVWNDFLSPGRGYTWSRPWALYTLIRWADVNGVTQPTEGLFPERSALAS
jgi:asparagine synthase (glutamine-hydrolysing)